MTASRQLTEDLAVQRARLLRALSGVTEEQFKRRPAATEDDPRPWCIAEVLADLLATDRIWAERIALALHDEGATVSPSDPQQRREAALAGRMAPVPQLIHGLLASQRQLDGLIEQAEREHGFERSINHVARGRLTVEDMLQSFVLDRLAAHVSRIEALREQVGAPPVDSA